MKFVHRLMSSVRSSLEIVLGVKATKYLREKSNIASGTTIGIVLVACLAAVVV
jgi:hypothetical protein